MSERDDDALDAANEARVATQAELAHMVKEFDQYVRMRSERQIAELTRRFEEYWWGDWRQR